MLVAMCDKCDECTLALPWNWHDPTLAIQCNKKVQSLATAYIVG